MSKSANIKIIKRRNLPKQTIEPKAEKRRKISKAQSERLLAMSILDWVRERRERQHNEEIKNFRSFFGSPDALASAV